MSRIVCFARVNCERLPYLLTCLLACLVSLGTTFFFVTTVSTGNDCGSRGPSSSAHLWSSRTSVTPRRPVPSSRGGGVGRALTADALVYELEPPQGALPLSVPL